MSSDLNDPIDVLNLSIRSYNGLRRTGCRTVGDVAALGKVGLRNIRYLGQKSVAEIQERLEAYFDANPGLARPTPLEVLGLSAQPYNVLMENDITTVEQLAAGPFWEVWDVARIGYESLVEIKGKLRAYLALHPLMIKSALSEPIFDSSLVPFQSNRRTEPSVTLPELLF